MTVFATKKFCFTPVHLFIIIVVFVCSLTFPLPGYARQTNESKVVKLSSAVPYRQEIHAAADIHGVDPTLLAALVKIESGFNPKAKGASGARGLMQLKPQTAARLGVRDVHDPLDNLKGGARYLAKCIQTFGNEDLALVAYNKGPFAVKKMQKNPKNVKRNGFVQRVKAARQHYMQTATVQQKPAIAHRPI